MKLRLPNIPLTDTYRALLGFIVGLIIMSVVVQVFQVNENDFNIMQNGVRLIVNGGNPWAAETRVDEFRNPPHSVIFLWPMLYVTPKAFLVVGGALLFAFLAYQRAWIAFAWFFTNTFLYLIAAGGIDMYVIGAGLCLLIAGDKIRNSRLSTILRVLAYGILMVKPQGGIFIAIIYCLTRRDWKGFLASVLVYGVFFIPFYPSWLRILLYDPPAAQVIAAHTLFTKFGAAIAIVIALLVTASRNWKYWQLGGALAGILMPYGMPGLPILLILTSVKKLRAAPILVIFSALMAILTWIENPIGQVDYDIALHILSIYHLSMLGLALVLCVTCGGSETEDVIPGRDWVKTISRKILPVLGK
jgi:hypothetical protein